MALEKALKLLEYELLVLVEKHGFQSDVALLELVCFLHEHDVLHYELPDVLHYEQHYDDVHEVNDDDDQYGDAEDELYDDQSYELD